MEFSWGEWFGKECRRKVRAVETLKVNFFTVLFIGMCLGSLFPTLKFENLSFQIRYFRGVNFVSNFLMEDMAHVIPKL